MKNTTTISESLMNEFANNLSKHSLWTDTFAVCNFLEFYRPTDNHNHKKTMHWKILLREEHQKDF